MRFGERQGVSPPSMAAHYFKMGQTPGCDKPFTDTPIRSKNGVPALRLSTKLLDAVFQRVEFPKESRRPKSVVE
jgi:hypothetical protein